MKKIVRISLGVILLASLAAVIITAARDSAIYENTLRLHVIAQSDSEEDQSLKLMVRDAVLEELDAKMRECKSQSEAENIANGMKDVLARRAEEVIAENGYDYPCRVDIVSEVYPRKTYGDATLPAGRYRSVKVTIGEGEGHNWWCVLYPPLCLSSASAEEELSQAGFTPGQVAVITGNDGGRYEIRLRIVEVASKLWNDLFGER